MKMKKHYKKIIGFDSWTSGHQHFERLLPALEIQSIEITLVHLGSWGNQPMSLPEEKIGNLLVRDVTFYGGDYFEKILEVERPDAVILLSTDTFAHRAFIRYCKQRSIPTLFLYHGLVNVQVTNDKNGSYKVKPYAHAKYVLSKISKLALHTLPCYVKSLLKTKASYRDWGRFISDMVHLATGKPFIKAADDAKTSKCAVYTQADVEHAMRVYGFKKKDVFVVGNPDLLRFGIAQSMLGSWLPPTNRGNRSIMYIDSGIVAVGLMFSGITDFSNHLISTSRSLAAQGMKMYLKLKPHPAEICELVQQSLKGSEIELVSNDDFLPKLQECSACITQASTLALIPALMGMPLLLANYDQLKLLKFGPVFTSYPRSYLLQDVSDTSGILHKDAQTLDSDKLNDWISINAGPLPADKMPERVADIVVEMISEKQLQEFS